jgi:hypothetical protein
MGEKGGRKRPLARNDFEINAEEKSAQKKFLRELELEFERC